jgi:anti-sigma B factor antagonist
VSSVVAPLTVSTTKLGADSYLVSVAGELDLHTGGPVEAALAAAVDRGARRLVVDLVGVTFLDSVGLGILTREAKRVRERGGECVVVADDPRIVRVFEITGLDRVFRIARSLPEAVSELAGGSGPDAEGG